MPYSSVYTVDGSPVYTVDGSPVVVYVSDLAISCPEDVSVITPIAGPLAITSPPGS